MTQQDPAAIFRTEADDLLEQLESALLDLGSRPGEISLIDAAFRALHTLKGSGAMFGYEQLAAFAHHIENAFDRLRKERLVATEALVRVALAARDQMRLLIEEPALADDVRSATILAELEQAMAALEGQTVAAAAAEAGRWKVHVALASSVLEFGTNPLLLLDEVREIGPADVTALDEAVPTLEEIDPHRLYLAFDIDLVAADPKDAIENVFLFHLDDMELRIEPAADPAMDKSESASETEHNDRTPAGTASKAEPAISVSSVAQAQEHTASRAIDSLRVPASRLDELMDRVGELVISQARLRQVAAATDDVHVKAVAEEIERLVLDLRDTTMGIRLLPIGTLFGRFRRMAYDLSHELGKQIAVTTRGEETELDKTVIDRLSDPLIHLIRNAIDHGMETPDKRRAAGKPECGTIRLSARHTGDKVLISIADDGKGLDRSRIRARAEEQGLLTPETVISDQELCQLIFHPGFSTASQITSVSGRGVGMDVVKKAIEALRGTIDIRSEAGQGTTVTLRLPLTLAIIDGLLVRIGTGHYVIPLSAIEECVELPPEENKRTNGRNFLNIRGSLVPYLRLRDVFQARGEPDPYQKVVIVSSGEMQVGLVVDQVVGEHQTVIKTLTRLHANVETFSGATILGDGTVALVLEVDHLVQAGQIREERLKRAG